MTAPPLVYYDRARGAMASERVHARTLLHWLYNTVPGGVLRRVAAGSPWVSRAYGWWQRQPGSRRRILPFVERMGIDMSECPRPIEDFESFADFFGRELDPARRPIDPDPRACIAPVDGKVLAYPAVDPRVSVRIKRSRFELRGLLRNEALADVFAWGAMIVDRLSLADCHHIHFPDSGVPEAPVPIPGRYDAGGPYALRDLVPFFAENHRMLTLFHSDHFGLMAIVEIGALTVGSIRQCFVPGSRVEKGDPKGVFELGGSTVVLLFRKGAIRLDHDLCARTTQDLETYVSRGERVGRNGGH